MTIELFPTSLLVDANILIRMITSERNNSIEILTEKGIKLYSTMSILKEFEARLSEVKKTASAETIEKRLQHIILIQVNVCSQGNHCKQSAHARLPPVAQGKRGPSPDWELVAVLLAFFQPNCAILSNDKDFWGIGVPVWRFEKLMSYLREFRPVD